MAKDNLAPYFENGCLFKCYLKMGAFEIREFIRQLFGKATHLNLIKVLLTYNSHFNSHFYSIESGNLSDN